MALLFRTRFRGAQFIIVSLKKGLFANANALFWTRFRDGTSVVGRTAQRSNSSLYNHAEREREEGTVERQWLWAHRGGHGEVLHRETQLGVIYGIVRSVFVLLLYPWHVVVEFRYLRIFL